MVFRNYNVKTERKSGTGKHRKEPMFEVFSKKGLVWHEAHCAEGFFVNTICVHVLTYSLLLPIHTYIELTIEWTRC